MLDNLLTATNTTRTALTNLRKKLSKIKIQLEDLSADLEKVDTKFENVLAQAEIYKAKLEREMGREVRRLERELALLRNGSPKTFTSTNADENEIKVASSVAIIDSILRLISNGAEDFRLISEAFLFPAVLERIISAEDSAYFLEEVPAASSLVIQRGRSYVEWVRSEYDTHLTDPDTWAAAVDTITDWWRNDALPLLYGSRDEQWDIDVPLSLPEMLAWRDNPAERPINFSAVFDAYEIFRKNKDIVFERSGLRQFELKQFTFAK